MMIAQLLIGLATLAPSQAAPKDDAAKLKAAREQAQSCVDATKDEDCEKLLKLTHKRVIEDLGGRELALKKLKASLAKMKEDGYSILSADVETTKEIRAKDSDLYCVLPTKLVIKAPNGKLTAPSFLVGVSTDSGKTWKFIDGGKGEAAVRKLVPEIPDDLKFPPKEAQKLEKDAPGEEHPPLAAE
jgi:hypothetical protein